MKQLERVKFISKENEGKSSWGRKGQKEGHNPVGSFDIKDNRRISDFTLYSLDDFDKDYYRHVDLKRGERLYRYSTHTTDIGNMFPLIKVNVKKGLVYFMESSEDDKHPIFQTVGTRPMWFQLAEKEEDFPLLFEQGGNVDCGCWHYEIGGL